jgi:hypothetical protein
MFEEIVINEFGLWLLVDEIEEVFLGDFHSVEENSGCKKNDYNFLLIMREKKGKGIIMIRLSDRVSEIIFDWLSLIFLDKRKQISSKPLFINS